MSTLTTPQISKGLNISLWIAQLLLAAMFIMAGSMKLFQSIEELSKMLPWVSGTPSGLVRFIGLSELLGGFGLVLPILLKIKPVLTPIAALGLGLIQVLAAIFHISRGENQVIGMNILLLILTLFIVWGRMKKTSTAS